MAESSKKEPCKYDKNRFCYVCGEMMNEGKIHEKTSLFMEKYLEQFEIKAKKRSLYAPDFVCDDCFKSITDRKWKQYFEKPMFWSKPFKHPGDCYFCLFEETADGSFNYPRCFSGWPPKVTEEVYNKAVYSQERFLKLCENVGLTHHEVLFEKDKVKQLARFFDSAGILSFNPKKLFNEEPSSDPDEPRRSKRNLENSGDFISKKKSYRER